MRLVVERRGARLKLESRQHALSATISTSRGLVTLAVPTTYMNESGAAFKPLLRRTSLEDLSRLVVAHDELDLEPVVSNSRSVADSLGITDYVRLPRVLGIERFRTAAHRYWQATVERNKAPTGCSSARRVRASKRSRGGSKRRRTHSSIVLDDEFDDAQQRVNQS